MTEAEKSHKLQNLSLEDIQAAREFDDYLNSIINKIAEVIYGKESDTNDRSGEEQTDPDGE